MNELKILKERQISLNKVNPTNQQTESKSSRNPKTRLSYSLGKKEQEQTFSTGDYLIGWGNIPFLSQRINPCLRNVAKNVLQFGIGEDHLLYTNHRYELFAMGSNNFNQLGLEDESQIHMSAIQIMRPHLIRSVFCTAYCSFVITKKGDLYACGMNNRGQLGLGHCSSVNKFQLVNKFSKSLRSDHQAGKLSSRLYQCNTLMNQHQQSYLQREQQIKTIAGGPLHTVILTTKGKIYITGYNYTNNEYQCEYELIPTGNLNKVSKIQCGVTNLALLNNQKELFIFGLVHHQIHSSPFKVASHIADFDIDDQRIVAINNKGNAVILDITKQVINSVTLKFQSSFKEVHCGYGFLMLTTSNMQVYGLGDNSQQQLSKGKNSYKITQLEPIDYAAKLPISSLKCSNNFVMCLSEKTFSENANMTSINLVANLERRVRELQAQNSTYKTLATQRPKKSIRMQTDKQSTFEYEKAQARTFQKELEIPFEELNIGKQISEGGYGIIYKATWRKTVVAVKVFKIDQDNHNSVKDFISECRAMEALRHPNIVMFLGACTKPPNFAIVLQYCQGGTLWSLLQKFGELSWDFRRKLALDAAKGINYLHQRKTPVLHRDLKSLNLLLDGNQRVKLADFGWTKGLQNYMTGKIGTYQWMAPEVVSAQQYTQKADVYSFGIILWEIASRQAPYRNIPGVQVAHDVMTKNLRPIIPKGTPPQFEDLIKKCWDSNPVFRPNFNTIIEQLQTMKLNQ